MRRYVIRCDACENTVNSSEELAIPRDWLSLVQTDEETRHFCSLRCLQRAINGIIGLPANMPHEPYPYCCLTHYPMPERKKP